MDEGIVQPASPKGWLGRPNAGSSYALLTYVSAYLKANYPVEFFCALMSIRSQVMQPKDWAEKAPEYLYEARLQNVKINPPDINHSKIGFTIQEGEIYYGLNAIRDVGKTAGRSIVAACKSRPFKDIFDFLNRVDRTKVTRKVFQALVVAGAFDRLGYSRTQLMEVTDTLYDHLSSYQLYAERVQKIKQWEIDHAETEKLIEERDELRKIKRASERKRQPGPLLSSTQAQRLEELEAKSLRRTLKPAEVENPAQNIPVIARYERVPVTVTQLLEQASYIGCFVGNHPAHIIFPGTLLIRSLEFNSNATTAGMVSSFKTILTKKGQEMAFMSIGDESGMAEVVIFPSVYAKLKTEQRLPAAGNIVCVNGRCEATDPMVKIIGNKIAIH
jgi:DNA polymerase-3 subunit alpha